MAARFTAVVVLQNPKTFARAVFHPGDDVPAWAKKLVTNPEVVEQVTRRRRAQSDEPADSEGDAGDGEQVGADAD